MLLIMFFTISVLSYTFYYRYAPVRVKELRGKDLDDSHIIIDVRDYQESYKSTCDQALAIPCGYLRRHAHEIPAGQIIVLGNSSVECNVGVRQLRGLGFAVVGYIRMERDNPCKDSLSMG
ncbi:sulfurtransferase [Mangrovibacillus sp. Mu-81]|uniref:sulfurtransferase n=1 Tax=Mangrovibacillus sp. Mu-81 TaxID=3121478 RepID=UPI002FE4D4E3